MNRHDIPLEMLSPWRLDTGSVARHYRLPRAVAAGIVAEQTQAALRRHWQAWVIAAVVVALWVAAFRLDGLADAQLPVLLLGVALWQLVGRVLARRRIDHMARDKAARLAHPDTSGWPLQ